MTKKDYELIARIIRSFEPPYADCNQTSYEDREQTRLTRDSLTEHFAETLFAANPLFDKERFYKACGVM